MGSETFVPRHVREYFIERNEYLALISSNPSMHAFYDGCQTYVSNSIQFSEETGKMTVAGKGIPVPGKVPELSETLLQVGEFGKTGWCDS